jgi:glycosyltransferase involved in cell wall biosynthesis
MSTCPLSVIVLTHNEARNLAACLTSVRGVASDIFVVDSGSTDATCEIARNHGATVATHAFDTHAQQWIWALRELPLRTDWVLALDADQQLTPELAREIPEAIADVSATSDAPHGYFINRRQIFRGRWIRHGGYYPKYLLKLFRRESVAIDPDELVDHHFTVAGRVAKLRHDVIEDNRNEATIAAWTAKHNRYAVLQARQELEAGRARPRPGIRALTGSPDDRTRWLKARWASLPLFVRPHLYVVYRYILRLGFLDGKEGFIFHVLQAFWYRLLVDINIDELRRTADPVAHHVADSPARDAATAQSLERR